jgi:hypothetical protein
LTGDGISDDEKNTKLIYLTSPEVNEISFVAYSSLPILEDKIWSN